MTQREIHQPIYTYQFQMFFNELLALNNAFKIKGAALEKQRQEVENYLYEQKKYLDEKDASGVVATSLEWKTLDRDRGSKYSELSLKKIELNEIAYRIELASGKLSTFFTEILNDLCGKYITQEKYVEYLKNYKEILDTGNNLPCFDKPSLDKVKKDIAHYLPE